MARHIPKNYAMLVAELRAQNDDRAVAIVGTSFLEWCLELALASSFRPLEKNDMDAIFEHPGLLSSLSSRITLAYALNIIGPKTRKDFDLIRKIRNEFAHNMNPVNFTDGGISNRCTLLKMSANSIPAQENDIREMFILSVATYSAILHLWSLRNDVREDVDLDNLEIVQWLSD